MRLAIDLTQRFDGEVRIDLRGIQTAVTEQFLYRADVGTGLQQMSGKAVAQRVRARWWQTDLGAATDQDAAYVLVAQPSSSAT